MRRCMGTLCTFQSIFPLKLLKIIVYSFKEKCKVEKERERWSRCGRAERRALTPRVSLSSLSFLPESSAPTREYLNTLFLKAKTNQTNKKPNLQILLSTLQWAPLLSKHPSVLFKGTPLRPTSRSRLLWDPSPHLPTCVKGKLRLRVALGT